jgi:hypothetical protein
MAGKSWRRCHGIGTNQAPSDDWQTDGFPKHKLVLPSTIENLSLLCKLSAPFYYSNNLLLYSVVIYLWFTLQFYDVI